MTDTSQQIAIGEQALAGSDEETAREDRFASLVQRQARFLFRVAYAVLRNAHDAEEVAQDTFLKLYRSGAWEQMENERSFLARAAWRMAVDRLPRHRTEAADAAMPSVQQSPEEAAISADWNAALQRLVDGLPEDLRQPLALVATQELTSKQIGEAMGIPEGTVRTRLMRARQLLKQKLSALMEGRYGK